jgi:flagellar motor switch protein FliM
MLQLSKGRAIPFLTGIESAANAEVQPFPVFACRFGEEAAQVTLVCSH